MNTNKKSILSVLAVSLLLSACAATPPQIAQKKTHTVDGKKLEFGGTFLPDDNQLSLTVNGDPIMKGSFPPFTPTQNINGTYKKIPMSAHCYFGSVLGNKKGKFGIVAKIIQSKKSATADKCEISVRDKMIETLYF